MWHVSAWCCFFGRQWSPKQFGYQHSKNMHRWQKVILVCNYRILIFVFILVPLRKLELRQRTLGECLQRYQALNLMYNQSNRWARCQWRVTSWPGILKACEVQPALAFCHSAKLSVCVSHNLCLWVIFTVFCQVTSSIQQSETPTMSKASAKTVKGESRSRYRLCVPPCLRYITSGDTHSLCVVCLGAKHAYPALVCTPFHRSWCPKDGHEIVPEASASSHRGGNM